MEPGRPRPAMQNRRHSADKNELNAGFNSIGRSFSNSALTVFGLFV
jgi:hypothetical protein